MPHQPRFIQIHTLHSYPAALINRDDAGLAKRLPLGNATRTRISSQCLKRHWRTAEDRFALSELQVPMAVRSRGTLELIRKRLVEAGTTEALALAAAEALRDGGLVDKAGKDKKGEEALKTGQAVLMGYAEIDYLVRRCGELASEAPEEKALRAAVAKMLKAEKKNIEALKLGSGLESALFGRMVTSDVLAGRDAAVYVAHAFTVHAAQVENDYFTVVDDLLQESGELGSAGIFDTELASGLYYGYVVVDVPQLVENLEAIERENCFAAETSPEQRALAAQVVEHLLHLIATVSPGAKRGSTAPFDWASFLLVEAGDWQPRSLAGAFHDALPTVTSGSETTPLRQRAVQRLGEEIGQLDAAYGASLARRFMSLDAVNIPQAERLDLGALASWTADGIKAGAC
ncbi:type I-E CRISPR-associated protein Cas7/Cse4/CasC [Halorhodospira abdelmalekii]|uniref:type I-E CRISPR-associated protein Cas7/Cse4/CasC n=1 Tax=Halorhodospira abdelmalekii TaxID=421629 RepID=UPI001904A9E1|nr:type I-E CRISPR-associated protein Cas7/Cse4/CasC [Halorhodospira abdelmalekii]MBK1734175.1 type I-E CRISPR-associated protein Cas7/Cse4/CasC [Halorhodospira abdelmalekii]